MASNLPTPIVDISRTLRSGDMQQQISKMLPPSVRVDKFTEVTLAAIQNSPEVLDADRDSLYRACIASARRGLLPDKREGALVVFNQNVGTRQAPKWAKLCQFMPMVEGIIKEMAKAGVKAYAVSVHASDNVRLWNDDDGQHVTHEPVVFGAKGDLLGVFAAGKTADGRSYVEALSVADVYKVAARSKQCKRLDNGEVELGGTWKSDFERMAQKSALHRLRKRLPILDELPSDEDEPEIRFEDEPQPPQEAQQTAPDVPHAERSARRSRTLDSLKEAAQQQEPEPQTDTHGSDPNDVF